MKKIIYLCGVFLLAGCVEVASNNEPSYDSFVTCLNQAGTHLYVSTTCPHCHEQKALFGASADKLNLIDCYYDSAKCVAANVPSVPTWIFANGKRAVGVQTFKYLSEQTNCPLPQQP